MPTASPSRGRALIALLRPDAPRWAVLGALLAASSALALAGPLVVRTIVDRATDGAPTSTFVALALLFLAIAVVTQIVGVVVIRYATVTAWGTTNELRLRMTRHVLGLDHEFHRTHTPGELIQRVDGDVTSVSDFLSQVVPRAVGGVLLVAGMLGVLTVLDWRLGLGMLVYLGLAVAVLMAMRHRAIHEASDEMGALARLYGGIEERLTASEDLRANGAGVHAMWRFVEDSGGMLRSSVRRQRAFIRMWWAVQGSVTLGSVLALVVSATLVANGAITVGTAFLLFQYVLVISRPLEDLVHQLETVQKANGAMIRVLDLLEVRATIVDAGTTSPPPGALGVSCRGVSFGYGDVDEDGDEQTILRDIDLDVAPGRSVGVVGRTGSGKTTFSRLLLRLVEPTAGTMSLGGVAMADIPLSELRRRVALVPQEVELFEGTIRDNVTLFDPEPSDDAVIDALTRAGLGSLARSGIHRALGAGGAGMSAGESQLLALARVWLRQPDLVVLDEATARIDPVTEQRLEAAVAQLIEGRTTFIIAHKLSTLRMVDEVVVFDHGRVVEHDQREVLASSGSSRWRQLLELALEVGPDDDDRHDQAVPA
ncbi:MAG TPA: ABC transporter ATP-binding protein [Ilumatobacteraceae bacterium]|nr:ABC transporter ATP-binding protein [Ilumatobacteraceae bacterium]